MNRYTKEGLPVVTLDTLNVFGRDMFVRGPSQFEDWLSEIDDENEVISTYMTSITKLYPIEQQTGLLVAMGGLYQLLKAQAEKNKIEEALGLNFRE